MAAARMRRRRLFRALALACLPALGAPADGVVVPAGTTLVFDDDADLGTPGAAVTLAGGTLDYRGPTPFALTRPLALTLDSGAVYVTGDGTFLVPADTPVASLSPATNGVGITPALTLGGSGAGRFDAVIPDVGTRTALSATGTAHWTIGGANTFTGTVRVGSGATLQVAHTQALGVTRNTLNVNGVLDLAGHGVRTGVLNGGIGVVTNSAPAAVTLDLGSGAGLFSGDIGGGPGPGVISLLVSGGSLELRANNSFAGSTTVMHASLRLTRAGFTDDLPGRLLHTSSLTIGGGGLVETMLLPGGGTPVNESPLTLGAGGGGGDFSMYVPAGAGTAVAVVQRFTTLSIGPGANRLSTLHPDTATILFTAPDPLSRATGGVLRVYDARHTQGLGGGFGVRFAQPPALTGGILGAAYTIDADGNGATAATAPHWLTVDPSGYLVPFTAYAGADDPNDTTAATGWVAGNNVQLTRTPAAEMAASRTINSLRIDTAAPAPGGATATAALDLGGNALTIASGGLLAASAGAKSIVNGSVRTGADQPDLVVSGNANLTVGARLDLGPKALTVSNAGVLTLSNPSNSVTDIYLNRSSVLRTTADGALGAEAGSLYFNGGTLEVDGTAQTLSNKQVVAGLSGGGVNFVGDTPVRFELASPVRLDGGISIFGGGGLRTGASAAAALSGAISGPGGMTLGGASDAFRVEIPRDNTFTGGTMIVHQMPVPCVVALGSDAALGTGPLAVSGWANLQSLDGHPRTIGNDLTVNGLLRVSGGGDFTFTAPARFGGSALNQEPQIETTGPTVTFAGAFAVSGQFYKRGAGTVVLAKAAQAGVAVFYVQGGVLRVDDSFPDAELFAVGAGVGEVGAAAQSLHTVGGLSGGVARVLPGRTTALAVRRVALGAGGSALDLIDNALILDYTGPSPAATTRAQILAGFAAGTWAGPGIRSSTAAANPSLGVGYAEASEILGPSGGTFLGRPVDGTALLLRTTLLGDATLDGAVDFDDLVKLAQNYNVTDGSRAWFTGDFTYDGNVDFNDLVKLAQNYNTALPAVAPAGASTDFARDLAAALAHVPEPSALASLVVAGTAALRRRRKQ